MSEIIYQKETKNWTKGNYALKTTRHALCRYIKERFNEFIDSLSYNDSKLIQFLDCLGRNGIKNFAQLKESSQAKQLRKPSKKEIRCEHNACIQLMEIFISIHQQKSSLRRCYVWKTSPCHPFQNRSLRQERKDIIWHITLLYMYVDKGDVSDCQSFEELDLSKVIKVMRNCTELCPDGSLEHLDNTLEWRNTLMHSAQLQVDDNSITQMLEELQKLLTFLQSSSEQCIASAKEIQRLLENDVYIGNVPPELKQIWKGVKNAKEVAEKFSSSLGTHSGLHTDILQLLEVLEDVSKREETPLYFEPTDYKKTIEKFIEHQIKAIDKDLVLLDKDSEDYKKLIKTQKTIDAIHENLKSETDEETAVEFQKFSQKQSMHIERIGTGNFDTEMKDNEEKFLSFSAELEERVDMKDYETIKVISVPKTVKKYQDIENSFNTQIKALLLSQMIHSGHDNLKVNMIEKIQNKTLYKQYQAKKNEMKNLKPNLATIMPLERNLWYCANRNTVKDIQKYGFSRSYCGNSNGKPWYGEGVYFAANAAYSAINWLLNEKPGSKGYMFVAKILTGQICQGKKGMRYPPQIDLKDPTIVYDCAVDNPQDPLEFVIFNDEQAYPAYIVTFTT